MKNFEIIPIDNVSSSHSAASALNLGLDKATGVYVVFCHQDVVFPRDWDARLMEQIGSIEQFDKNWGVLGTFGVSLDGRYVGNVIDPHLSSRCGELPSEAQTLDEHCLIIRKSSNLRFDEDLKGFHLYGADLCLEAKSRGMSNYAIDACLKHLSPGNVSDDFHQVAREFVRKWKRTICPLLVVETTCGVFRVRGGARAVAGHILAKTRRWVRRNTGRRSKRQQDREMEL